jgi:endonuclease III
METEDGLIFRKADIHQALMRISREADSKNLFPTVIKEAAALIYSDPYAFALAASLDRGMKADIVWTIPYDIKNSLGHLDPQKIYLMGLDELARLLDSLPRHPRYTRDAPRTIQELTKMVVENCGGDASNIWEGKRAFEVKRSFESIFGVGPGIANMAVLLIEKAFNIRFDNQDHAQTDIKPDVHTVRVLYRLGVSNRQTEKAAIDASRLLNPAFPGELDGALWEIGRKYCNSRNPECQECPMTELCVKRIEA